MDPLDDLLKNIGHAERAPLPEGFEAKVLNKWFEAKTKKKKAYAVWMYTMAACLAACTCMNVLSLNKLKSSAATTVETSVSTTSLEEDFVDEYGLEENMSYYSLNQ